MSDLTNPYMNESWAQKSPGLKYQKLVGEIVEGCRLFGLNITPRGEQALDVLIQECEDWWRTSDHATSMKKLVRAITYIIHFVHPDLTLE